MNKSPIPHIPPLELNSLESPLLIALAMVALAIDFGVVMALFIRF